MARSFPSSESWFATSATLLQLIGGGLQQPKATRLQAAAHRSRCRSRFRLTPCVVASPFLLALRPTPWRSRMVTDSALMLAPLHMIAAHGSAIQPLALVLLTTPIAGALR